MPTSRVALVRGADRYDNVSQALERIAAEIDLADKQRVLVKPNFVVTHTPLAATHVDAVRAVLDFVRARDTQFPSKGILAHTVEMGIEKRSAPPSG